MAITTMSSREFNQDTSRAKQASNNGPVFITDRGRPAHVLITIEEYQKLTGGPMTLVPQGTGAQVAYQPLSNFALLTQQQDLTPLVSAGAGLAAVYWLGLGTSGLFAAIAAGFCIYAALTAAAVLRVKDPAATPR